MATFKLQLDRYVKRNGKQTIQLRITVNRRPIPRSTGFEVLKKDWDKAKERVKASHPNFVTINDALTSILTEAEKEFALTAAGGFSADAKQIADKTFSTHDFYQHAQEYIDSLTGETELRTQKNYQSTLNSLKTFMPAMLVEQVSPEIINAYRKWLQTTPRSAMPGAAPVGKTTVIKRLVHFRALYNLSPHKRSPSPFEAVKIGVGKPARIEPLSIAEIARLWAYEPETPNERSALDMFLFSFYTLGMRIGDVIRLQWADVKEDRIRYDQSKKAHLETDNVLEAPLNRYNSEILERWPKTGKYVFGRISATDRRGIDKQVESVEASINLSLKKIALKCGVTKWIAGKLARKTFSDIASKRTGRNIYSIQQALGHSRVSTTEGYVGRDVSAINELAEQVYK
jgi:integrase/recombinase XerD